MFFFDKLLWAHVNARKEASIKYPSTDSFIELDFWIPSLKLGFEYQVILLLIFFINNIYLFKINY